MGWQEKEGEEEGEEEGEGEEEEGKEDWGERRMPRISSWDG